MPEAVIVATARSPIGRAFKGSLKDVRPDDLAATIVAGRARQGPGARPGTIDDLYLGCGQPGGEQGYNMARVVAVLLGCDHVPGATINRYCSSSLQTTRMAFHAIKAGEGDVFISRRRRVRLPLRRLGRRRRRPRTTGRTRCSPTPQPAAPRTRGRRTRRGTTRARTASCPTSTSRWARPPRTSPACAASPARSRTSSAYARQNLAEKAIADGFFAREITPVTPPDGTVVSTDDGPRAGVTLRGGRRR